MPIPSMLVAVAHGTRDPRGVAVTEALLEQVRVHRPGLPVRTAYIEIAAPLVTDVLAATVGHRAVVVPLLLGPGYHATVDLPRAVAQHATARLAPVLGPDPLLATALADRLHEAGWAPGMAIVLAAAGSANPAANAATQTQATLLAERLGSGDPVVPGYGSAAAPDVTTAVAGLRARKVGSVVIASYLLAPGVFHTRLGTAGADLVTAPLAAHDAIAQLVLARFDQACGSSD